MAATITEQDFYNVDQNENEKEAIS